MPSDIEKGLHGPGQQRSRFSIPRRKLPIVLFALLAILSLSIFFIDGFAAETGAGIRFLKDSISPVIEEKVETTTPVSLLEPLGAKKAPHVEPLDPVGHAVGKETLSILAEWAKAQGRPFSELSESEAADLNRKPGAEEKVLLLLQAIKDEGWEVPSDWKVTMLPGTAKELAVAIEKQGRDSGASADAEMYRKTPTKWITSHRRNNKITVFSKSYCPHSKAAKETLSAMKASFKVIEVDLRPDHARLQPLLASMTGHRTFPAIFMQGTLLGGNDDLQNLKQHGILEGLLQSAGALD